MRWLRLVLFVALLVSLAPAISLAIAGVVANHYGCQLDEGSVHPCIIGGVDYGHTLLVMFMMGWFLFMTLPLTVAIVIFWVVIEVARWVRGRATPVEQAHD